MRTQSGTGELRVLVYLDEVMGLAPPVGNPPTKKPILTLLKQARAFGVGMISSTQNPVDLDYKAISNAGTWLIGRLQTEQDKNRLIDGLRAADGGTDISAMEQTISGLGQRQFVLRTTRSAELPLLTTRWAMSYLAGPLTGDQITTLMADEIASLGQGSPTTANRGGETDGAGQSDAAGAGEAGQADSGPSMADDESTLSPSLPGSLIVRYPVAVAPWSSAAAGVSPSPRSTSGVGASAWRTTDSAAATRVASTASAKSSATSGTCQSGGR